MVKIMENPIKSIKMDDLGGKPQFFETPIWGGRMKCITPNSKRTNISNELPWHLLMKLMIFRSRLPEPGRNGGGIWTPELVRWRV